MPVTDHTDNGYCTSDRYAHTNRQRNQKYQSPDNVRAILESRSSSEDESNLPDSIVANDKETECESDDSIEILGEASVPRKRIFAPNLLFKDSIEKLLPTPDKVSKRKRSGSYSSSEGNFVCSPEIPFTGKEIVTIEKLNNSVNLQVDSKILVFYVVR